MIFVKKIFDSSQTINNEIVKRNKEDNRRKIETPESGGNNIVYLGTDNDNFFKNNFENIYNLCEKKYQDQIKYNKTLKKGEGRLVSHRVNSSWLKEIAKVVAVCLDTNESMYHNPNFDYDHVLSRVSELGEFLEFESELVFIRDNNKPKPYFKWFDGEGFELLREFFIADLTRYNISVFTWKGEYYFEWEISFDADVVLQLLESKELNGTILKKALDNSTITQDQFGYIVERLVKTRVGQGKFRKDLLNDPRTSICPFTKIQAPELLIASHIKPWSVSTANEKVDIYNGLIFTPSYDFLFDKGFISFTNDKKVILSNHLDKNTFKCFGLETGNKHLSLLPTKGREYYLEYHRKHIFKS